jgi:hypothetical protein
MLACEDRPKAVQPVELPVAQPVVAPAVSMTPTPEPTDRLGERYTDPKGRFKINPPAGWKVRETREDPRSKVAFIGPRPQVDLRVLVSDWETSNFEVFHRDMKANVEDVQRQTGAAVELKRERFLDRESLFRAFTYQGVQMTSFMFLEGRAKHDVQYGAPPAIYADYEKVVMAALATYEPLEAGRSPSGGAKAHRVANALRLATLFVEMKQFQEAREHIDRGLAIDPQNVRLMALDQKVKAVAR